MQDFEVFTPSQFILEMMIADGIVSRVGGNLARPCYIGYMPDLDDTVDNPPECAVLLDGEVSQLQTERLPSGETRFKPIIDVAVRSPSFQSGWEFINKINRFFTKAIYYRSITLTKDGVNYTVTFQCANTVLIPYNAGYLSNMQGGNVSRYQMFQSRYLLNVVHSD